MMRHTPRKHPLLRPHIFPISRIFAWRFAKSGTIGSSLTTDSADSHFQGVSQGRTKLQEHGWMALLFSLRVKHDCIQATMSVASWGSVGRDCADRGRVRLFREHVFGRGIADQGFASPQGRGSSRCRGWAFVVGVLAGGAQDVVVGGSSQRDARRSSRHMEGARQRRPGVDCLGAVLALETKPRPGAVCSESPPRCSRPRPNFFGEPGKSDDHAANDNDA
jgi:hypothetical protein